MEEGQNSSKSVRVIKNIWRESFVEQVSFEPLITTGKVNALIGF